MIVVQQIVIIASSIIYDDLFPQSSNGTQLKITLSAYKHFRENIIIIKISLTASSHPIYYVYFDLLLIEEIILKQNKVISPNRKRASFFFVLVLRFPSILKNYC